MRGTAEVRGWWQRREERREERGEGWWERSVWQHHSFNLITHRYVSLQVYDFNEHYCLFREQNKYLRRHFDFM